MLQRNLKEHQNGGPLQGSLTGQAQLLRIVGIPEKMLAAF